MKTITIKITFLLTLFFLSFTALKAQDIIVTKDNKFLEVKIISSDESMTYYKPNKGSEIKRIETKDIKMIKWNSKKRNSSKDEKNVFTPELTKQGFYLEKKKNTLNRNMGIATLGLGTLSIMTLKSARESERFSDNILGGMFGVLGMGLTLVSGVVYLATFAGDDGYELKPLGNSLSNTPQSLINQKLKKQNDLAHIRPSSSGLGLQLNF